MKAPLLLCCAFGSAAVPSARADYRDNTGFTQLSTELGAALPDGTGVGLTHVEAKLPSPPFALDAYLPLAGSGTFPGAWRYAGKQFTAKSGAGAASFHADEVAAHYYGNSTGLTTTFHSMCPGVVDVDCYSASDWTNSPAADFLAPTASSIEPVPEIRAVQCHAWIYEANAANAGEAAFVNDLVRRQDYSINRDSYVCSVGLSNLVTSQIPDLWAAGYNVLTVGLSNGQHSRGPNSIGGTTTSDMDGPGRRKPDLVAPLAATSYAAGYIGSAAGLLRQKANSIGTANARHVKTLKAVLLAGATKDEFPAWSRTATHPIDAIYGAGELNIHHSYFILNGGEQPPNNAAGRPHLAWDYHDNLAANGTADYRLNIPAGQYSVELSAFVVWHRTLTDSNTAASVFTLAPDPLINFTLTLFRDPAAGGTAVPIDTSTSTLYNLEHVWQKNLPAGNYRLRVSRGNGLVHPFALAWRLHTTPHQAQPVMASAGNNYQFTFPGLLTGQPYKFQSSPNLTAWTDLETFTATTPSATRLLLKPANPRLLYRLLPILP